MFVPTTAKSGGTSGTTPSTSDTSHQSWPRVRPGDVFVDVGASLGYYTVLAGRLVGAEGRVVACEPGPQNQNVLLANVCSNRLFNVDVHQTAVSDQPGFVLYSQATSNGTISPFEGDVSSLSTFDLVQTCSSTASSKV